VTVPAAELARDDEDLRAILRLQRENLAVALSADDLASQGFVTIEHTLEVLRGMHEAAPSVIVRDGAALPGYALTMTLACRPSARAGADARSRREPGAPGAAPAGPADLPDGPDLRGPIPPGPGGLDALYAGHASFHGPRHDIVVTEIAGRNGRSLRAHQRVGFFEMSRHRDALNDWVIVGWDFGRSPP
jgi:hypothetical protein